MLCDENIRILCEEIRKLEERELTWQTCDKLCTLYQVREYMGHKHAGHERGALTMEQARTWVESMRGEDPAVPHGGKWTVEQVKPIAAKYGVLPETQEFTEFWAAINAMYSDYCAVAKKYGTDKPDFYADLAMAFIHDKDAGPGKVERYYECVAGE